jgi:hypothetical protein
MAAWGFCEGVAAQLATARRQAPARKERRTVIEGRLREPGTMLRAGKNATGGTRPPVAIVADAGADGAGGVAVRTCS